ncbi:MAG: bifunctional phosphoribosylaminoimidazolecarboxamide formyltransferase/IMP cyclohydrolase [Candidatus Eisenbacteria bacterium]|nr:bifunctional phosphoribosylaminoimidazolecarboxamide formyltransferase/IMP cyclohydrolase [Candidatus Eisenbacteria bacterium]
MKPRRALLSVSNREGLDELGRGLSRSGVEVFATRGTAGFLKKAGISCFTLEEELELPELLHGRIKTLREKLLAGVLVRDNVSGEEEELSGIGGISFQIVVCNFYPFSDQVKKGETGPEDAVEMVDIGGVALVRAAAKNWEHVAVLSRPSLYGSFISELDRTGEISRATRLGLASIAFRDVKEYDNDISSYFSQFAMAGEAGENDSLPQELLLRLKKEKELRYGENPDRDGAFYSTGREEFSLSSLTQVSGEGLSYTNLLDVTSLSRILRVFSEPASCVIKHGNPCGVGEGRNLSEAFSLAIQSDPVSSFGSVIGFNREIDEDAANLINAAGFIEAIVAPSFSETVVGALSKKSKRRRLLLLPWLGDPGYYEEFEFKQCPGGMLVQTKPKLLGTETLQVVTERKPSKEEMDSLLFAWKIVEYVQSNAVVIAKGKGTVGIGAGQMNRLYSISIALRTAGERAEGAAIASDGFFPMVDNVEECARGKVSSIIQPGGSIRDREVIDSCNRLGISMVFTGRRCFKH